MTAITDQDRLRLLLPHWIEHNQEHAAEFRRWAERGGPTKADILAATDDLEAVNHKLTQALERLGGPLESQGQHSHSTS